MSNSRDTHAIHNVHGSHRAHPLLPTRRDGGAPAPDDWEHVAMDLTTGDAWHEIDALLTSSYGGSASRYLLQYDPWFLREHALAPTTAGPPLALGVRAPTTGRLVAFVAATPTPVTVRGAPGHIALVNLWCARPDVRGTGLSMALIRRLRDQLRAEGLLDGVLFTGSRSSFSCVSRRPNWVRVLDASALRAAGLLSHHEPDEAFDDDVTGWTARAFEECDLDAAHALFVAEASRFDVTQRLDTPDELRRFLPERGVSTWAVDDAHGALRAWFSLFYTSIRSADREGAEVRVANLWALAARDVGAVSAAIRLAVRTATADGYHLLASANDAGLPVVERDRLGLRPGPRTNLYTHVDDGRYRNLTIHLPFA